MKLYREDTGGDAPPLLLIAGLASDAVSWVLQQESLSARHRLLICDNRGMARSPGSDGPFSIADMAGDIVELLDDLEIERVHLVGHSMGGAVAQHLAITFPDRVDRLILACTFSRLGGRSLPVIESWARVLQLGADSETLGCCLFPWLYTEAFLATPGTLDACQRALAAHPYRLDADVVTQQVAALRGFDSTHLLHRISAPTLVLAAEQDLLVSADSSRELAEAIPGARLQTLPGTGHSCMLETPDLFNRAVLAFTATE